MSLARRARAGVLLLAALAVSACGGADAGEQAQQRADAARGYASGVAEVTERTRAALASTSAGADYRDAAAAETTTRSYATTIRGAADELTRRTPPEAVADEHRQLVELYRTSATRLDAIAADFRTARGRRALAAQAQALSGEVQTLATREAQLRTAIDAELALAAPTSPPTSGAAPGDG